MKALIQSIFRVVLANCNHRESGRIFLQKRRLASAYHTSSEAANSDSFPKIELNCALRHAVVSGFLVALPWDLVVIGINENQYESLSTAFAMTYAVLFFGPRSHMSYIYIQDKQGNMLL